MSRHITTLDAWLSLDELCNLGALPPDWVRARLQAGLLQSVAGEAAECFDAAMLQRACRMASLERDFDAVPELAALVADLEDEISRLRARLQRLGWEDASETDAQ